MNKTFTLVAGIITVLGLGAAWVFGKIDGVIAGLISAFVLSTLYGFFQKLESTEVKARLLQVQTLFTEAKNRHETEIKKLHSINGSLLNRLEVQEKVVSEQPDVEQPTKAKRRK